MPLPKTKDVGKIMRVLNKEGGRNRKCYSCDEV